jgi:hypothetical protein
LGNTAAVGRHEGVLKFITDRGNVMRAEVEAYYRSGIRSLISEVVDEEFNKISFILDVRNGASYDTVLTRNPQNGQYTLNYKRPSVPNSDKTLAAPTLAALLSGMRNDNEYKADFDEACINTVEAQAKLIPAVVYAEWKAGGKWDALALVKEAITNFYLNSSADTYNIIHGISARYFILAVIWRQICECCRKFLTLYYFES